MASRADLAAYKRSLGDLSAIVDFELRQFWASIDTSTPESARVALDRFLPELVATYGDAAALLAADFFDHLRSQAPVRGSFVAVMADPAPPEQVQGANRWAVGPLNAPTAVTATEIAQALANAEQVARRLVIQPARQTITQSVRLDPARPRWARVPTGAKTCAFCLVLASRGAVYETARTAGQMHDYHADCDCQPTPIWEGDLPEGYDPDALYATYQAARRDAGGNPKAILAELRAREGIA